MPEITKNKAAYFNYQILETFEAGIRLSGPEVKSVKQGQINLKGAYVTIHHNEAYLINAHIAPYKMAVSSQKDYRPTQSRKLLLKRKEIDHLTGAIASRGLTILPLSIYTVKGIIKVKIGLAKGKKKQDKREAIKKREVKRKIDRAMRMKA